MHISDYILYGKYKKEVSCCIMKNRMIVLGYKTEFSAFINKKKIEEKKLFSLGQKYFKNYFIEICFLFSRNCLCVPAGSKMEVGEEFP